MDMIREQRFNPLSQLALLLVLCGGGFIASGLIALVIGNQLHIDPKNLADELMKPENVSWNRLFQVFSSFLFMALPAFVIASINGRNPAKKLGFNEAISRNQILIVVFMVIAGFLVSGALGDLNQMIPVPKTAEVYFKQLEDEYNKEILSVGYMKTTYDFVISIIVLAFIPAIFEEMLFRGCLQKIMISLTRNVFVGIFITSIIFSAIHFSYYGFLPRLFLSIMLGYIFYFGKNLWLNITAHFLNNAYPLTVMFMLGREGKLNTGVLEETVHWGYGIIGAIILIGLFVLYKKESERVLDNRNINEETL